jgi:hypothetical protein
LSAELFKYGGTLLKNELLKLFNIIWHSQQIPTDWETGIVINLHKKGSRNNPDNYRGITLLSTASKLYSNILKNKLNKYSELFLEEEQCGFRKGRSTTDAIFTLQQILEKEENLIYHCIFCLLTTKKHDNVNPEKPWQILHDKKHTFSTPESNIEPI